MNPSSNDIDLEVRREALRNAVAGARTSVPLLWLVVVLMLLPAPALGLYWLMGLVGAMALASGLWRLSFMRRLRPTRTMDAQQLAGAERQIQANAALSGLMWGFATLSMYPLLSPTQATIHFLVQLGSLCMAAFYMSMVRRSFEWIALPVTLPLIGLSLFHPHLHSWALALGTAVFLFALLRATTHFRVVTLLAIRRGLEADAASQQLRLARDHAQADAEAKSRFLATMSHELRTPLSGALGSLSLLDAEPLNPAQKELLGGARQATQSLLTSLNDVLIFSEIEAGKVTLQPAPVSLAVLVQDILAGHAAQAAGKGLNLRSELAAGLPEHVLADEACLRPVLHNLVSNALKFSERGQVCLRVSRVEGAAESVHFEVADTGIGMSAEGMAQVFQPFRQLDQGPQRAYPGAGLGLAVAQRLVQLMGGQIEVQSRPGRGSSFGFSLTLPTTLAQPVGKHVMGEASVPASLRGSTVLVVEDNALNRMVAVKMLQGMGLKVLEADNGEAALKALHGGGISLVLMDGQMPVLDGYAATRQWREHEQRLGKARTPIVAVTANAMPQDKALAEACGMDDLLAKPFAPAELALAVVRWIAPTPPA